jgi:hypothetical protein
MLFALQRKLEIPEQRLGCEQMIIALRETIAELEAGRSRPAQPSGVSRSKTVT